MKASITQITLILALLAGGAVAQERPANNPRGQQQPDQPTTEPVMDEDAVGELIQAVQDALDANKTADTAKPEAETRRALRGQSARGSTGSGTNVVSLSALVAQQATNGVPNSSPTLRLNFRDASLSLVLDYLSEAAGFVVSPSSKVDLKGKVTVMASQPVTRDEAVAILHKSLGEHNYAANIEGNILNIYVVDSTTTPIPDPISGSDYASISPTKEMVTQVVYVRNVEAAALISSLQPLMPTGSSMSANQGANAIIITDTKANIRRMVQLVKVLDTPAVSASAVEVIPLTYADATALAQVITQLFQTTDSSTQGRGGRGNLFGGFGGPFGGGGGDRGGNNNSSTAAGRVAAPKVTAVADERSNSLVVTAPADQMPSIIELVGRMDVDVDAVTELKVFRLRNADPQETADQLTSLFPDPATQQNQRNRGGFGFGPFANFGGGGGGGRNNSTSSSRTVSQTKVTAVPDPRTQSVLVSASHEMMPQIAGIIEELDSDPAKKKKVHVIKVENRDPQELVQDLQSVIATDTSGGTFNNARNSQNQSGSQLNTRQQNNLQNQGQNQGFTSGFGQGNGRTGGTGR